MLKYLDMVYISKLPGRFRDRKIKDEIKSNWPCRMAPLRTPSIMCTVPAGGTLRVDQVSAFFTVPQWRPPSLFSKFLKSRVGVGGGIP